MNYKESNNHKKSGTGFYILIAVCLIVIALAAWFAIRKIRESQGETPPMSSDLNSGIGSGIGGSSFDNTSSHNSSSGIGGSSEYNSSNSSYNGSDNMPNITDSSILEPTAEDVDDEPYDTVVYSMPVNGEVIKSFDPDNLQYSATYKDMRIHTGVDIACETGTSVSACADGTVTAIAEDAFLGTVVTIEHEGGLTVKYCSIDDIRFSEGQTVTAGDIIGLSAVVPGECEDEPHIHVIALKDSKEVDLISALGLE